MHVCVCACTFDSDSEVADSLVEIIVTGSIFYSQSGANTDQLTRPWAYRGVCERRRKEERGEERR